MTKLTKPMLAADLVGDDNSIHLEWIKFPVLATPKIDGIRCILQDGIAYTRSMKQIPNHSIFTSLRKWSLDHPGWILDGELMTFGRQVAGTALDPDPFNTVQSKVMRQAGEPIWNYLIFDCIRPDGYPKTPYEKRFLWMVEIYSPIFQRILPVYLYNQEQLLVFEQECLSNGFEGICFRTPSSPYKQGRATVREGYLTKLKRYETTTGEVIGFEELYKNNNPSYIDETGHSKRSSRQDGLVPAGTLGALLVALSSSNATLSIGSGFTEDQRQTIWNNQASFLGKTVRFKHLPHGAKDLPRHPVFLNMEDSSL